VTLLTTKEVQELIAVDKSTIYRMAEDGRLPAVKVGRQWRFPADGIAALLGTEQLEPAMSIGTPTVTRSNGHGLADLLDPEAAQAIADLVGDLFGVMAVLTDMAGRPLTQVANPCGFFDVVQHQPGAIEHCTAGWRELGEDIGLEARFRPSHLGFLCARTFIRAGSELVGMLIVGGVTPSLWPPGDEQLAASAAELGVPSSLLAQHVDETYYLDEAHQQWVLGLLPRIADLISLLAAARSQLLAKLNAIAVLAAGPSPERSPL
jgi:excisionase family DNA binding protein